MWIDAFQCLQWPHLARWTVYGVHLRDGHADYEITAVRFRWRRSALIWIAKAHRRMRKQGRPYVELEARQIAGQ